MNTIVRSVEEAQTISLCYPVEVRPAFTLQGQGHGIAFDRLALIGLVEIGLEASPCGEVQLSFGDNCDASDELRPKGSSDGTAAARCAEEAGTQQAEESRDGQAEGSGTPETKECGETVGRDGKKESGQVSRDSAEILAGGTR